MNITRGNRVERLRAMGRSTLSVVCAVVSLMTLPSGGSAAEVVVPNSLASVEGNINNTLPWNCGSFLSQRYQQVYLGAEVGSGKISGIAFRSNGGSFGPTIIPGVTIMLSSTTNGPDQLSTTFAANVGADVTTVFSGNLTLSAANVGSPPFPFEIAIPLQTSFTFTAGTGKHLLLDVNVPACVTTDQAFQAAAFDAHVVQGDSVSRVFDFGAIPGVIGQDSSGLVTRFTIEAVELPPPPPPPPPPPTTLVASVLPSSRSVQLGVTATAFVLILNAGPNPAVDVGISLASPIPATLKYNRTDCKTNAVIGGDNVPVTIPPGVIPPSDPPANQACYVISITPTAAFDPTEVAFNYAGINTPPVTTLLGINTLLMSASVTPVPDIVALAGTATGDGILHLPGPAGVGAFVVATSNVGIGGLITASANTGPTALPLALLICQTDPVIGVCISPIGPSVTVQINALAIATFAIFATASGTIVLDPANNRIFVVFADGGSVVRGRTSVAATTQ